MCGPDEVSLYDAHLTFYDISEACRTSSKRPSSASLVSILSENIIGRGEEHHRENIGRTSGEHRENIIGRCGEHHLHLCTVFSSIIGQKGL